MHIERSAGVFFAGVWFTIGGTVVGWSGVSNAVSSASSYYINGPSGASVGLAAMGFLAVLAGAIILSVELHRDLVKIDTLPAPMAYVAPPQHWSTPPTGPPSSGLSG